MVNLDFTTDKDANLWVLDVVGGHGVVCVGGTMQTDEGICRERESRRNSRGIDRKGYKRGQSHVNCCGSEYACLTEPCA